MAESDTKAPRQILVVALAFLGGVTGIAFGRVFLGTHPAVRLAVAGVAASLLAALLARRPLVVSLTASAAGLALALGLLVFPDTTWAGLPGLETLDAFLRALDVVTHRAATEVAPAPPLPSLMTAALIAVWSASAAAHALAVRSGSSVLPLLPSAALLAFSGVVTEDPPRPGYVLLFLAAAFAVLFAQAMQRASSWGARRARTPVSGRWARRVGVAAALAAVWIPGVLPGFARPAVLEVDKPNARIGVSPIVDIRPSLLQNPVADLFWVTADRPAYWRMVVLDRFDGRVWLPSPTEEAGRVHLGGGAHQLAHPPAPASRELKQRFEIGQLAASWLPAAANPAAVTIEQDLGASHDLRTGVLELAEETTEGMVYDVTSTQAWPSQRALKTEIPNSPLGDPRYTELPPSLPERIQRIAVSVTRDADTPLEEILAIQDHLRGFQYDDRAPAGHGIDDLLHFLEVSKRGYCEQFAGAMAVLVRALGYPARVAIGFLPGGREEGGRFRVTTAQVHAWPEVHFGEYGWLAFEPTPGRSNPSAEYLIPAALRGDGGSARSRDRDAGGSAADIARLRDAPNPAPNPDAVPQRGPRAARGPLPWWGVIALAITGLVLVSLAIPPAKAVRRRIRLSRARDGRGRVLTAYDWVLEAAGDLGAPRRPSETPIEYQRRILPASASTGEPLATLTALADRALYASGGLTPDDGDRALAAARSVVRDLRRAAGRTRTVLGALRPVG